MATATKLGIVQHGQLDGLKSALARCRDAARDLPAEELPDLIGELEAIKATAWARLTAPALATQEHDELLDVETAAERLGVSRDYRRQGRKLLFSALGVDKHIRQQRT